MNKVLFIAPHPDDETLGCGGTILKHKAAGDEVSWLIMTNISVEEGYEKNRVKERQREIETVAKEFGFKDIFKLDFPTTKLDAIPSSRIVKAVSDVIDGMKPEILYIPNRNDVHTDHKVTFEAVMSASKSFRSPSIRKILMYEVISDTEFSPPLRDSVFCPNVFLNISGYLEKKLLITRIYASEVGKHPFPRSAENIKALATFRGATAGVKYAEAFMVVREVW